MISDLLERGAAVNSLCWMRGKGTMPLTDFSGGNFNADSSGFYLTGDSERARIREPALAGGEDGANGKEDCEE
jgi:hypothetical protein